MKGIIRYDSVGNPICELCGGSFSRLLSHVRQVHSISARDYKVKYGLDVKKGICSKVSSERSRLMVIQNFDKVVTGNLISGGSKTRYSKGHGIKKYFSEQSRLRIIDQLQPERVKVILSNSGKKFGKYNLIKYNLGRDK